MVRYKPYERKQRFFQVIDPVAFRDNNPLLRSIDDFVDEHLPVENFSKNIKNDEFGAAALDPRLVCKVLFYAIASGVRSYRSIEQRLAWDPAFMILSAGKMIDHSTLCRFISVHREALQEFFTIMVYILVEQGCINKDFFATDGTKIKGSVGKDFTGTCEDFERRSEKLGKRIAEILESMGNDEPDPGRGRKLKTLEKKKEKIDHFIEQVKTGKRSIGPKDKINLTDSDTGQMKDKDSVYAGYNLQLTVDSNHFIAAYEVFNCTADQPHLQPMIKKVQKQFGEPLSGSIFSFDAGYYSPSNILFLDREKLVAFIPEGQAEDGTRIFKQREGMGSRDCILANRRGEPVLKCPGGQTMTGRRYVRATLDRHSYKFTPKKKRCLSCSHFQRCYRSKTGRKAFEMEKTMIDSVDARKAMAANVASAEGRAIRNKRFSTNEHVNAEIKDRMGLRQFFHRGKDKVRTIACLTAIGYNFRRLAAVS